MSAYNTVDCTKAAKFRSRSCRYHYSSLVRQRRCERMRMSGMWTARTETWLRWPHVFYTVAVMYLCKGRPGQCLLNTMVFKSAYLYSNRLWELCRRETFGILFGLFLPSWLLIVS